jgi:demethylmenaquinone methyltransferase / 2-methoxy-6-polyprenyl-1,4-benzoquinol methylase
VLGIRTVVERGVQPLARKIFEGLSPSYDRVLVAATLMQDVYWKSWLLEHAVMTGEGRVLDIGCGTGVLEERIGGGNQAVVVGVDLTEEMIRRAQLKHIPSLLALGVGDGEHLPFRDGSFDTILSCYVVKYCNPQRLAGEMGRVLRRGGTLVLYDFSSPRGPFAPFHALYAYGILKILGKLLQHLDPQTAFTYLVLPDVIRSRVWDSGFEEILKSAGFAHVGRKRLTGGVVTGYWAQKS